VRADPRRSPEVKGAGAPASDPRCLSLALWRRRALVLFGSGRAGRPSFLSGSGTRRKRPDNTEKDDDMTSKILRRCSTALALGMAAVLSLAADRAAADQHGGLSELLQDLPSNWDRWGEGDEVGSLNFLDQDQALRSAGAAVQGKVFTLQIPFVHGEGPVFPGRVPARHFMSQDEGHYQAGKLEPLPGGAKFSDDAMFTYLQGTTHVDALAHAWEGEEVYGGVSAETTVGGHTHAGVGPIARHGIVGRGVLLDVGRHLGPETGRLAPGTCISLDDLRSTAEAQDVTLETRDILVIRTGSIPRFFEEAPDQEWDALNEPGLCYSRELVEWVHEMEIPVIAADNLAVELVVQEIEGNNMVIPLHIALMRNLGTVLIEILWLEDLAEDSAEDGQYTFQFIASPLKLDAGSGSPVNPIAVK
jgi:kynurenine formamidase